MEERENKYLKNKNFNFRLGFYIITILIFLGVATFKISSSIREFNDCLLYTSPSPRDRTRSRMPSSAWKKK